MNECVSFHMFLLFRYLFYATYLCAFVVTAIVDAQFLYHFTTRNRNEFNDERWRGTEWNRLKNVRQDKNESASIYALLIHIMANISSWFDCKWARLLSIFQSASAHIVQVITLFVCAPEYFGFSRQCIEHEIGWSFVFSVTRIWLTNSSYDWESNDCCWTFHVMTCK